MLTLEALDLEHFADALSRGSQDLESGEIRIMLTLEDLDLEHFADALSRGSQNF